MAEIKESRQIKIENRIITLGDIQRLSNVIFKEYGQLRINSKYANISFIATCDDRSVFESEDPCLFDSDSVLSSKSVKNISINCICLQPNLSMEISIVHGNNFGYYDSGIVVRGIDPKWVNGTLKLLEEVVNSFSPQCNYIENHRIIIRSVFSISIGWLLTHTLILALPYISTPEPTSKNNVLSTMVTLYPLMLYPISYCIYVFFGFIPAGILMQKLSKLWPSVELQIGPEHKFIEKRRRVWVTGAILLGVIPMVVQFVYDVAKHLAKQ